MDRARSWMSSINDCCSAYEKDVMTTRTTPAEQRTGRTSLTRQVPNESGTRPGSWLESSSRETTISIGGVEADIVTVYEVTPIVDDNGASSQGPNL